MTDGHKSRATKDVLPLSARLDMECQTVLLSEVNLPLSGATVEKNDDDGTRTAWTVWTVWTAVTSEAAE